MFRIASSGRFTRAFATKALHQHLAKFGIDSPEFIGHSFRRGAAQSASDNGLAEEDIQLLGRWTSDSVKRYYTLGPRGRFALSFQAQRGHPPPST